MKILELDLKKKVLIVQPEETGNINYWVTSHSKDWDFICLGSELTEEIASELVDFWQNTANDGFIYENYKTNLPKKETAVESFISAVESKDFHWLDNPISGPNKIIQTSLSFKKFAKHSELFDRAEEKTFRNPLIFVKK